MTRRGLLTVALCAALSTGGGVALAAFTNSTSNSGSTLAAGQWPTIVSVPDLRQTAQAGTALSVSTGVWSQTSSSYAYTWLRCDTAGNSCTNLATTTNYTPVTADVGSTIRARVTPIVSGSPRGPGALTEPSQIVRASGAGAVVGTTVPSITGTPTVGGTLTASNGTWSTTGLNFSYQWLRCDATGAACTTISLQTASTYQLTTTDKGKRIRVCVTAVKSTLQPNWVLTDDVGPVT